MLSWDSHERIQIIFGVFLFLTFVVVARLFTIQVLAHGKYVDLAEKQHWISQTLPARRGNILAGDGFVLASSTDYYLLYGEPHKIEDISHVAETLAHALSPVLDRPEDALIAKYTKRLSRNLRWVPLENSLPPEIKDSLSELSLQGVGFEVYPVRFYPEHTLASHVLGFVAQNTNGERVGYFGVEGALNGELSGKDGKVLQEKDALGRPILTGSFERVEPIPGSNVTLTLDRFVQYLVERELKAGVERFGAKTGSVIVMDPQTGAILAMANYPTFDPSHVLDESQAQNLAIAGAYEPGSVMKPITVASGLVTGAITRDSTFVDSGPVTYSGYTIDNWDGKHHGVQTIAQLLAKSNNIGAAWVGHRVGSKHLYETLRDFGFGSKTGIELEGESAGLIRPYKDWTDIDLANISFGQGLLATPLQILNAFNVFANGGLLYRPYIVSSITTFRTTVPTKPKVLRRVLSESVAKDMADLLEIAVSQGEAHFFNIKGYKVSGKTGTAQISESGSYSDTGTNATFVGYLTTSKKFSMLVRLERPSTSPYAAETAVPLWMSIAKELATYYSIPPDIY